MTDPFQSFAAGLDSPYTGALTVTPSDDTDLAIIPRAIWATTGIVRVTMRDGGDPVDLVFSEPALHRIRVKRVHETGTECANIVALW